MTDRLTATGVGLFLVLAFLASGCVSLRELAGFPAASTPTVSQTAEPRWVLVKNPRFGDVPSEPEYIWMEEDKIPWTFKRVLFGKGALLAPPEIVAKYGSPPGGGKISPLQGVAYNTVSEPSPQARTRSVVHVEARAVPGPGGSDALSAASPGLTPAAGGPAPGTRAVRPPTQRAPAPSRGYVVYVDTNRVVIDLTAQDGLQPGSVVSLRRDKIPIIHPVTGELLGELDEEVATAKVVELRDRFSVAEIQSVNPGAQVKVKDRVVPR